MSENKKNQKKSGRRNSNKPVGRRRPSSLPQWPPFLEFYRELVVLNFKLDKDLDAAIGLLWTDELRTLPHDTPDGKSIVIPAEAVPYFSRAGLKFTQYPLRSVGDLSPEEIAKLRRG
jgi:hypothetical protein